MSIISFIGGMSDFYEENVANNIYEIITTSGQISSYSRFGFRIINGEPSQNALTMKFSDLSVLWYSSYFYFPNRWKTTKHIIRFGKTTTNFNELFAIGLDENYLTVYKKVNGSWSILQKSNNLITSTILYRIDININLNNINGVFDVFLNGIKVINYVGDTILSTSETIDTISFVATNDIPYYPPVWSNIFVSDEDSTLISMVENSLTSNGTYQDMQGSVSDINSIPVNDSTFILSDSTNQKSSYITSDIPSSLNDGYNVIAKGVSCRAIKGDTSTIEDIQLLIYSNNHISYSSNSSLNVYYSPHQYIFDVSPDGSVWTIDKANNVEVGVKSK